MTYDDDKYISDINNTLETLLNEIGNLKHKIEFPPKENYSLAGLKAELIFLERRIPMMDNTYYQEYEKTGKKISFAKYLEENNYN